VITVLDVLAGGQVAFWVASFQISWKLLPQKMLCTQPSNSGQGQSLLYTVKAIVIPTKQHKMTMKSPKLFVLYNNDNATCCGFAQWYVSLRGRFDKHTVAG
jgi:hypothetical protein